MKYKLIVNTSSSTWQKKTKLYVVYSYINVEGLFGNKQQKYNFSSPSTVLLLRIYKRKNQTCLIFKKQCRMCTGKIKGKEARAGEVVGDLKGCLCLAKC